MFNFLKQVENYAREAVQSARYIGQELAATDKQCTKFVSE
jgi:hypothetical protein